MISKLIIVATIGVALFLYLFILFADIANTTGILLQDIIRTMEELEMLQCSDDGEV